MLRESPGLSLPQPTNLKKIMNVYPIVDLLRIIVSWNSEVVNSIDAVLLIGMLATATCLERLKVRLEDGLLDLCKLKEYK
jgi:hypothetical protein